MTSPTHSPLTKRRSDTGPAAYRHNAPDGLPVRRVSAVDISSVNEKLEDLSNDKENNKAPLRRRTTLPSMCPMYKTNNFKRDESFDEEEVDEDEEEIEIEKDELNGEASLIGLDEESLSELVDLSQQIEANLEMA